MKRRRHRIRHFITALAVAVLVAGLWRQRDIEHLRSEYRTLTQALRSQGISVNAGTRTDHKRIRDQETTEAAELTELLIHFPKHTPSAEIDYHQLAALVTRIQSLNAVQIRAVIKSLTADTSGDPQHRNQLLGYFIGKLAEDHPREVLAMMDENPPAGLDAFVQHQMQAIALQCWATTDPKAAWDWVLRLTKSLDSKNARSLAISTLHGVMKIDPAAAFLMADQADIEDIDVLFQSLDSTDQKAAAVKALRYRLNSRSSDPAEFRRHVMKIALAKPFEQNIRFSEVTEWFQKAELSSDELSFLADGPELDLGFYIEPQETGKWIEWLQHHFSEEKLHSRMQRLFEDSRTSNAAKAWLSGLPEHEARMFSLKHGLE